MTAAGVLSDRPDLGRYEYRVAEAVAFVRYQRADGVVTLSYARVPDELGGLGVGSTMVRAVLEDVRARGERVIPTCSFVAAYIARHPDCQDLLAGG